MDLSSFPLERAEPRNDIFNVVTNRIPEETNSVLADIAT